MVSTNKKSLTSDSEGEYSRNTFMKLKYTITGKSKLTEVRH